MLRMQACGLTHRYGSNTVLHNVDLETPAGGRLAVVGPNGAGKSTLLRLLAGLERPTGGEVVATDSAGRPCHHLALRRRVTMVLQRPFLFHTTVLGNVLYGLRVRGVPRGEARQRARRTLASAGLASLESRPAGALSVGESQLLNLARALALEPEVLLLDEVTAHLDPDNQRRVEELVLQYHAERGAGLLFVTQNLPQAFRMADEGVMLYRGQVLQQGRLADFVGRPRTPRVAEFVQAQMLSLPK